MEQNEPIPNKDHDPAEDGSKMLQQVYTGLGIPPTTSMWHLPRKPLSPKSAGKTGAFKASKTSSKGHSKSRSRGGKHKNLFAGWD